MNELINVHMHKKQMQWQYLFKTINCSPRGTWEFTYYIVSLTIKNLANPQESASSSVNEIICFIM